MRRYDSSEVGGPDILDVEVAASPRAGALARLRTRAALGLEPALAPAVVFVPLGVLLGPLVLGIVSEEVLAHLDTVVSIALAALGVFVGVAVDLRDRTSRRTLVAASVEALVTIAVVLGAALILFAAWGLRLDANPWSVALILGISASASSAGAVDDGAAGADRAAAAIANLDDVLPLLLGGVALAWGAGQPPLWAVVSAVHTVLLGAGVAAAGWLLFERAHGAAERAVFVVGTVVLLGGVAAYLALSPMLAGLAAGVFWTSAPGRAEKVIRDDLGKIQHALVVLLLVTAGASLVWTPIALWLFAPFVVFRLAGKLIGGSLAAWLVPHVAPADLGSHLIAPGVLGLAFALNFQQVAPSATAAAVLAAATAGSLACEVLGVWARPRPARG
ncbi:MAG TPA: hypothetical protein VIG50_12215 [Vicinamibacteria bacterium]